MQNANRVLGEILRMSMMTGQVRRRKRTHNDVSSGSECEKENWSNDSVSTSDSGSSRRRKVSHVSAAKQLGKLVDLMERHEKFQESILQEHCKANENQERMSSALLDILRQGLLN